MTVDSKYKMYPAILKLLDIASTVHVDHAQSMVEAHIYPLLCNWQRLLDREKSSILERYMVELVGIECPEELQVSISNLHKELCSWKSGFYD